MAAVRKQRVGYFEARATCDQAHDTVRQPSQGLSWARIFEVSACGGSMSKGEAC